MTTAYTSLLGLALPVTGELSGTWGDTVNNSITSLLDSAIAGTTTLSSDVDVTLTTTTGASNTSRQAILLWTAGGTVTRNITAPAQSKIYTVINASSSTQSIVLRGVGPTTGVTIVKGESAVCAWNGSDFIKISNTGGAAVFTTLDVTNLEVTNIKAFDGTSAASIANSTGVISLTANPILSGGTANGVAYLNGSKVLTTGSALVFDGTSLGVGQATPNITGFSRTITLNNATGAVASEYAIGGATQGWFGSSAAQTQLGSITNIPVVFYTNNTERMRLDSSGNLGLGVTPAGWSGLTAIQVGQAASLFAQSGGDYIGGYVGSNIYYNAGWKYIRNGYATKYDFNESNNGQHRWWIAPNNTSGAGAAATETQAMTLDASGNLLVGATSSSGNGERAHFNRLNATKNQPIVSWSDGQDNTGFLSIVNSVEVGVENGAAISSDTALFFGRMISGTFTERARIDSSGNLLVGSSSTIGTGGKFQVTSSLDTSLFKCTSSTTYAAIVSNVENTAARLMAFQYGSGGSPTNVGTITTNGTGVTYGTSSDYRLKENIAPMIGALDKVAQLKPVTYKWKANGSDGQGFIAHELKEVVSDAVQGEKDAVDEDGNPVYQGIDTSFLVATLTAAIQEQQALITQLTARITALEGA